MSNEPNQKELSRESKKFFLFISSAEVWLCIINDGNTMTKSLVIILLVKETL